ncbi:hypothetical protein [Psychromicrobium lacuslunae]|uniref:DUF8083 domain-containing protein n=1 Tax=Psychromicrobium lacuslunae TaxID=1618207 RepID=A0A0D4C292_9MICC|nr:hypothetical protein [Psychromicrobium lacuslunae]AJT42500.1 hypothetical protein UM93_15180 [Psychromicrobium lacuslunae]
MAAELYLGHSNLPYLSALRLYLPLESFHEPEQQLIQFNAPPPAERMRADLQELGDSLRRIIRAEPFPGASSERVRSLQMSEQDPVLFNLNQVLPRSLTALAELRAGSTARLANAVFSTELFDDVEQKVHDGATGQLMLTRSSGWGIPFGWFVMITESDRTEVVESRSRVITVRVQVPVPVAQQRLQDAIENLENSAPDLDLLEELRDLAAWLSGVSGQAAVELDYGAIADRIYPDESPSDVRLGLECLAEGDLTGAAAAYRRLASRWIPIRQLSRAS